jgi:hypothetical protein
MSFFKKYNIQGFFSCHAIYGVVKKYTHSPSPLLLERGLRGEATVTPDLKVGAIESLLLNNIIR